MGLQDFLRNAGRVTTQVFLGQTLPLRDGLARAGADATREAIRHGTGGVVDLRNNQINLPGLTGRTPPFFPETGSGGYQHVHPPGSPWAGLPIPSAESLRVQPRPTPEEAAGGYFDFLGRNHRAAQIEASREKQPIWQQHVKEGENTPAHDARRAEELQKFASDIPKIRAFLSPDQQKMLDAAVTVRVNGADGRATFKSPAQRIAEWESLERSLSATGNGDALFEVRALRRLYPSLTSGMDGGIDNTGGINARAAELFRNNGQAVTGLPVAVPAGTAPPAAPAPLDPSPSAAAVATPVPPQTAPAVRALPAFDDASSGAAATTSAAPAVSKTPTLDALIQEATGDRRRMLEAARTQAIGPSV